MDNEENQSKVAKMTRRKLLGTLGVAGAALVTGGILNEKVYGQSITESVYGNVSSGLLPTASTPSSISGFINVMDFGAVGDGVTDDSDAIQRALDAAFAAGGGSVWIGSCRCYISKNIIIPTGCGLIGYHQVYNGHFLSNTNNLINTKLGSLIIINPSATIIFNAASHVVGLILIRQGCRIGDHDNSNFSGTALSSINPSQGDVNAGTIRNCMILGFNRAIDVKNHHRICIENVGGDNNNGIRVDTSWDVMRINNVHFWPYVTNYPGVTLDKHHRPGNGIELINQNDICQVTNVFIYGYHTCFRLNTHIGTGNFINCHGDGTQQYADSRAFHISGGADGCAFVGCSGFSCSYGVVVDSSSDSAIIFVAARIRANTSAGFEITSGEINITDSYIDSSPYGINIHEPNSKVFVKDTIFKTITTSNINSFNSAEVFEQGNIYDESANIGSWNLPQIVSGDPLILPRNGNFFSVSGSAGFGTIIGGWTGRKVILKFNAPITIFDGTITNIAGNFNAKANDILELIHDGSQWLEISRSSNN